MKVSWNPPPIGQHGGLIQGYKVIYSPLTSDHGRSFDNENELVIGYIYLLLTSIIEV